MSFVCLVKSKTKTTGTQSTDISAQLLCGNEILTYPVKSLYPLARPHHGNSFLCIFPALDNFGLISGTCIPAPQTGNSFPREHDICSFYLLQCSVLSMYRQSGWDCTEVWVESGKAENTGECMLGWEGDLDQYEQRISFN